MIFIVALLYLATANAEVVLMGEFGPGIVVFRHYDRVGPILNFENPPDIPLHISGRLPGRDYDVQNLDTVILDSQTEGYYWQNQVRPYVFKFPIGTSITEIIEVTEIGYDIRINGNRHVFNHRLDVTNVTRINSQPVNHFSIGRVLKQFSVGRVIYIKATAPSSGDFKIDLLPLLPQEMTCRWHTVSLVLHSMFSATPPSVTRTSYGPMDWSSHGHTCGAVDAGKSDREMPFEAGKPFELTIVAQQFGFEIGVNGSHFASYTYRLPLSSHMTVMLTNVPAIETIEYH